MLGILNIDGWEEQEWFDEIRIKRLIHLLKINESGIEPNSIGEHGTDQMTIFLSLTEREGTES